MLHRTCMSFVLFKARIHSVNPLPNPTKVHLRWLLIRTYTGTWGTGAAAAAGAYKQTTTYTQSKGAHASVNFTGSAVYLYGLVAFFLLST